VLIWLINLVLPGAGLIIRRREWLGFLLTLVFGICGNAALAGLIIAPLAIPRWMTGLAVGMSALAWVLSQLLFWRQLIHLERCRESLAVLLEDSRAALAGGDHGSAHRLLERAAAVDDEHLELNVLWARLCTSEGDESAAQRRWRRVIQLDVRRTYHSEARMALGVKRAES